MLGAAEFAFPRLVVFGLRRGILAVTCVLDELAEGRRAEGLRRTTAVE